MKPASSHQRILVLQGHPDATAYHLNHALADAYAEGAQRAGHAVRRVEVAALEFPLLRSKADWETGALPDSLRAVQDAIHWAGHIVVLFPLWLGDMPALLKGFFEQVARPGFAVGAAGTGSLPAKLLSGRSARVVVTMGMPVAVYRWYFRAHSIKALERNILGFAGIAPIRTTFVGSVENLNPAQRQQWLVRLDALGAAAH